MNITLPIRRLFLSFVFLLPGALQADEFSIVIIPDTQMYTEAYPQIFEAQVDWIKANQVAENIIYVAHLGDLKDDLECSNKNITVGTGGNRTEWEIVDDTFTDLETISIAYGVVPGNHDYESIDKPDGSVDSSGLPRQECPNGRAPNALTIYNQILGPHRFSGRPYYGDPAAVPAVPGNRVLDDPGTPTTVDPDGVRTGDESSNEDNFTLFAFGDTKFIAINLAYKQAANPEILGVPQQPELDWADALLKAYPDRVGIITSHYFINDNPPIGAVTSDTPPVPRPRDNFGSYGQEVYTALSDNRNLLMMLSAHEFGEAWRVETRSGILNPVHGLLSDYQRLEYPRTTFPAPATIDYADLNGGKSLGDSGFMRIMRFDTVTGMVSIESFAPTVPSMSRTSLIAGTTYHLVSDITVTSGDDMDAGTASNLSFPYLDYAEDTTPDAFSFTNQTDVATSTLVPSNTTAVTGINADTDISISGGEYSIDGGAFTSADATITASSVSLSQSVQVRQTSSASFSTQTDSVLTIGGVSDTFSVTTLANSIAPIVEIVPRNDHPPIPAGNKVTCISILDPGTDTAPTCPIIRFNDITYYAYSYIDNRVALNVVAYDAGNNIVQQTNLSGVRYIHSISINTTTNTVTFTGQVGNTNSMTYSASSVLLIP